MRFMLRHRHDASECAVAYAAWRGFESPLRRESTLATCAVPAGPDGPEHLLMWTVEAPSVEEALAQLPPWLAARAEARPVPEGLIP